MVKLQIIVDNYLHMLAETSFWCLTLDRVKARVFLDIWLPMIEEWRFFIKLKLLGLQW